MTTTVYLGAEALLPADAFTHTDLADIYLAGGVFASAVADIAHHHIGDPGFWDCYGTGPDELARLHAALDQMAEADQGVSRLADRRRAPGPSYGRASGR